MLCLCACARVRECAHAVRRYTSIVHVIQYWGWFLLTTVCTLLLAGLCVIFVPETSKVGNLANIETALWNKKATSAGNNGGSSSGAAHKTC